MIPEPFSAQKPGAREEEGRTEEEVNPDGWNSLTGRLQNQVDQRLAGYPVNLFRFEWHHRDSAAEAVCDFASKTNCTASAEPASQLNASQIMPDTAQCISGDLRVFCIIKYAG